MEEPVSRSINLSNAKLDSFIAESLLKYFGIDVSKYDKSSLEDLQRLKAVIDSHGITLWRRADGMYEIVSDSIPAAIVGGPF